MKVLDHTQVVDEVGFEELWERGGVGKELWDGGVEFANVLYGWRHGGVGGVRGCLVCARVRFYFYNL